MSDDESTLVIILDIIELIGSEASVKMKYNNKTMAIFLSIILLSNVVLSSVQTSRAFAAVGIESADVTPPELVPGSLNVSKVNAIPGDVVTIRLKAIDDMSGVKSVNIYYFTPTGSHETLYTTYDSLTDEFYSDFNVDENTYSGEWKIYFISITDNNDVKYISDNNIDLSAGTFTVDNPNSDVTPPELVPGSLNVSKVKAIPGDVVTIRLKAIDDMSGVKSVNIYYFTPTGSYETLYTMYDSLTDEFYSDFNVDENTYSGEWKIYFISITDNNDVKYISDNNIDLSAGTFAVVSSLPLEERTLDYEMSIGVPLTFNLSLTSEVDHFELSDPNTLSFIRKSSYIRTYTSGAVNAQYYYKFDTLAEGLTEIRFRSADGRLVASRIIKILPNKIVFDDVSLIDPDYTLYENSEMKKSDFNRDKYLGWVSSNPEIATADSNYSYLYTSGSNGSYQGPSYSLNITAKRVGKIVLYGFYQGQLQRKIVVEVTPDLITSAIIKIKPTKLDYKYGEALDVSGGVITLTKASGVKEDIPMTPEMVTGYSATTPGPQTITVTYEGKTIEFQVNVIDSLISAIIKAKPSKLVYKYGEALDVSGGVITLTKESGATEDIAMTPEMVSGYSATTLGTQTVTVTYEDKTIEFQVTVIESVSNVFGMSRYSTAVAISQASYASASTAILVLGTNFPDALSAGPLAIQENAPILLTKTAVLPQETTDELIRLGVGKVIILGGESVVGPEVVAALTSLGIATERISGNSRYETAIAVARQVRAKSGVTSKVILTNGWEFADALSIGSYASKEGIPILLTKADVLQAATKAALLEFGVEEIIVIGGNLAVSEAIITELQGMGITITRSFGSTRFETVVAVAEKYFPTANKAIVSFGYNFADALSAAPYAAMLNAPIVLVRQNLIPTAISEYISRSTLTSVIVIGGNDAVGVEVKSALEGLLIGK